jgi:hypothetical protein
MPNVRHVSASNPRLDELKCLVVGEVSRANDDRALRNYITNPHKPTDQQEQCGKNSYTGDYYQSPTHLAG